MIRASKGLVSSQACFYINSPGDSGRGYKAQCHNQKVTRWILPNFL